ALAARRETLGDQHPSTLTSIFNLGALLQKQGRLGDAIPLFREELEGYLVSGRQFPLHRDYGFRLYRDYHDAEQSHTIELKDVRNWTTAVAQLAEYCELEATQSGRKPRGTIVLFGSGPGFCVTDAEYNVVTQGAKIINKVVEDKNGFQLQILRRDAITAAAADVATTKDVVFRALARAKENVASKRARDESGNAHTHTRTDGEGAGPQTV
ncbi:hypothetical protein EMIHUDRAFT_120894, partial [Emiliania huxleyi CCMP1516]|uniref:Kinesin light chain n=2 Tax=Emiliania huxleyi TaxID=2903 RepID=A0A0D3IB28_EMIH1